MPIYTILLGVVLVAIGIGTYIGAGEAASTSALILQLILGLLAIGLGVGSIVKKEMKKHLIHGAMILAAMGVIVPLVMFGVYLFQLERDEQMNLLRALLTVAFSGAYIYLGVKSFKAARKGGKAGTTDTPEAPKRLDPEPGPAPSD
ncbi:MAG: hypothetical protein AAF085_10205 [Planctomycetota bacterium]